MKRKYEEKNGWLLKSFGQIDRIQNSYFKVHHRTILGLTTREAMLVLRKINIQLEESYVAVIVVPTLVKSVFNRFYNILYKFHTIISSKKSNQEMFLRSTHKDGFLKLGEMKGFSMLGLCS